MHLVAAVAQQADIPPYDAPGVCHVGTKSNHGGRVDKQEWIILCIRILLIAKTIAIVKAAVILEAAVTVFVLFLWEDFQY